MKKTEKEGILLFAKYPEIGKVKSRLSESIDRNSVVKIYKLFVQDILMKIKDTPYETIICYYPDDSIEKFKDWIGEKYLFIPQIGKNLGERLKNSFEKCFSNGFSKLIAIGGDSPDLKLDIIKEAFDNLKNYDSVIGPCADGGYYLIGFSKESFYPTVFDEIPWSTAEVFKKTMDVFSRGNQKVHILPKWYDVDTIDDLLDLYEKNLNTDFKYSKTMDYLSEFYKKKRNIYGEMIGKKK